jgi:hypothetical protein
MATNTFETMLSGGHPNSLGRTFDVVDVVLKDQKKLEDLYQCYFSDDEVVRLRVSSAMKRVCREKPSWLVPYIDKLLDTVSEIDQASTQWTLAILFDWLRHEMSQTQQKKAVKILKRNLEQSGDWIVQNTTMQILANWSETDNNLKVWLIPKLEKFKKSSRKSVAGRANKLLNHLV